MWSLFCSLVKIDRHRPFWKYLSIVTLAGALIGSYTNKIDSRCSRCAAHSNNNSCWCWETYLNWLKILLVKTQSSPRFFWRKSLNFFYIIGFSASKQYFYQCHRWNIALQRNKMRKRTWFGLLALPVLKWLSYC